MKALVLYDSKYGNTKMVADEVAKGLREKGMDTETSHVDGFKAGIEGYDVVALGTPNQWGRPTKKTRKAVKSLSEKDLGGKTFGFFDTCLKGEEGKATRRLAKQLREIAPGVIIAPELSILVGGMKGPIVEGEMPKCAEFVGGLIPEP